MPPLDRSVAYVIETDFFFKFLFSNMTCLWLYSNGLLGREVENSTFPAEKMKK